MATKKQMERVNFDVDSTLKKEFEQAVEARLSKPTLILRHFMASYVAEYQREQEIRAQLGKDSVKKRK